MCQQLFCGFARLLTIVRVPAPVRMFVLGRMRRNGNHDTAAVCDAKNSIMLTRNRRLSLGVAMAALLMAPLAQAEFILVSAGTSVDTDAWVNGLFESGEESDSDDPLGIDRTDADLPIIDSQSALATITSTVASASASIALQVDNNSITGSGQFSKSVDAVPQSFASAYARAILGVKFTVTQPTPYTFSGSITYDSPDHVIAPTEAGIFLVENSGPLSNFTQALDSTEPFSFSGVLAPGTYDIGLIGSFGGVSLETINVLSAAESGSFDFEFTVVPLPAAGWLFLSSLGLLGWMKRRSV